MRSEAPLITPGWKRLLWLIAAISVVAAFLNLASSWAEHDQSSNDLHVVSSNESDKEVRIHGHLNADRLAPGGQTTCWYRVQNVGTRTIAELKMRWSAAGFEPAEFVASKTTLQPGEMMEFRPKTGLIASETPQRFMVTAEFQWCSEIGSDTETLFLGPVIVRTQSERRVYAISKMWVDLLKNLALPIVLIVATSLFSTRQRNAEARSASWNLMLEKSHANAEQYYMPLSSSARLAAVRLKNADPTKPDTFDPLTFQVLQFLKRYRALFEKIAGFYLTTRSAERIVVDSINAFNLELSPWIDQATRSKAKDYLDCYMELHVFNEKVRKKPEVQAVKLALIAWSVTHRARMNAAFAALTVMAEVLTYDINLNYRFWYEDPPDPLQEFTTELSWLRSSGSADLNEIATKYERYRAEVAARSW